MGDVNGNERCHSLHIKPDADERSHSKAATSSSLSRITRLSHPPVDNEDLSRLGKWQSWVHVCDMAHKYRQQYT
jgi:hypothetical protein